MNDARRSTLAGIKVALAIAIASLGVAAVFGFIPTRARQAALTSRARPADNSRLMIHDGERPTTRAEEARRYLALHPEGTESGSSRVVRWQPIGPQPTRPYYPFGTSSGRITDLAVSPADPNIVLVGTPAGGIWRSADGGRHFVPVSDDLVDSSVASIAFSQSNPTIVYAAMGDPYQYYDLGNGVLRSDDAGETWRRVDRFGLDDLGANRNPFAVSSRVIVDEQNFDRVLLAQEGYFTPTTQSSSGTYSYTAGVYRSVDGGVTWARTLPANTCDIAAMPGNPSTIYAVSKWWESKTVPPSVYRSDDGGLTWATALALPYDTFSLDAAVLAVTPAAPNDLFLFSGGRVKGQFEMHAQHSRDRGATWNDVPLRGVKPDQFWFNHIFRADPTNPNILYVGTTNLYRSENGGETWGDLDCCSEKYHADQHAFAFDPRSASTFYLGNDGGVFVTTDAGKTFSSLNATMSLVQFYSLVIDPLDPDRTYGGTQDNGSEAYRGTADWQQLQGGDGEGCVVDPNDGTVYLAVGLTINRFSRALTFSKTLATSHTFNDDRTWSHPPLKGNGVDGTLYFATYRLYVSSDHGVTWIPRAGGSDLTRGRTSQGDDTISSLAVSSVNPSVIYVGSAQGRVQISRDGGSTWTDISAGIPNRIVSGIATDPRSTDLAYAVVAGWSSGHVFVFRGGSSWIDITGDLPDVPVNCVAIDPVDPTSILVGTDLGVFTSHGDLRWEWLRDGMPPAPVSAIATHKNGVIRAATFGRGVYEAVLRAPVRRRAARH